MLCLCVFDPSAVVLVGGRRDNRTSEGFRRLGRRAAPHKEKVDMMLSWLEERLYTEEELK